MSGIQVLHELGDRRNLAHGLEIAGYLAREQAQWPRAGMLLGAAESLRTAIGAPLPPDEQERHEHTLAAVRVALGPEPFNSCWAEGQALVLDRAVVYVSRSIPDP